MSNETLDEIGLKYTYNYGKGKTYTGGDKTSLGQYFTKEYERIFYDLKEEKINLLELGIYHGKSLAMWSDYFTSGHIYGLDIDLKPFHDNEQSLKKHGAFKNNNINILEYDITKDTFKEFIDELPNFNIIIDDALHIPETQYNNFMLLFPKIISAGY